MTYLESVLNPNNPANYRTLTIEEKKIIALEEKVTDLQYRMNEVCNFLHKQEELKEVK